ncbi:PREDICTED: uncharacterized protein LOC104601826 [Nelumbo nucifera]|uniref:Uncharacterized protein LOC104601826 n=1 Tax=Nelumbo nucifera TaxID=4432 RepID=A0A1U8AA52_NELNU|nr:PREDICTED: uncharacterized protein LOC104601826 [Nelumbo nucifera]
MPPTFTAITLDRLLEPGTPKSVPKLLNSKLQSRKPSTEKTIQRPSPSLYATPEATPLPDSPSSFAPSPYIVNHKRRGPRLLKTGYQDDASVKQATEEVKVDANERNVDIEVVGSKEDVTVPPMVSNPCDDAVVNGFHDDKPGSCNSNDGFDGAEDSSKVDAAVDLEIEEGEDFFDPQESMSFTSNTDLEESSGPKRPMKLCTPMGEFYDAWEELSSEVGQQSGIRDIEAELREIRLNLLTEIERRKQAEEALSNMQRQWQRIGQQLSLVGLRLPTASIAAAEDEDLDFDLGEDLCQQMYIARFVSNSVGRGSARAEIEEEMESQIELKNFEIARLWDRLHYYEAVNHEMSQRNQEAIEMARQRRQRRKRRRKLVWGLVGTAIIVGAAALAWSYLPASRGSSTTNHSDAPRGDDATEL